MSKKKTPPSYTDPGGPKIVETHSYRLSPLGPALNKHKNNVRHMLDHVNNVNIIVLRILCTFNLKGKYMIRFFKETNLQFGGGSKVISANSFCILRSIKMVYFQKLRG